MNISNRIKQELLDLLLQIANPGSVAIVPDLSNPEYRYYQLPDGTYKSVRKIYNADGKLV